MSQKENKIGNKKFITPQAKKLMLLAKKTESTIKNIKLTKLTPEEIKKLEKYYEFIEKLEEIYNNHIEPLARK